MNGPIQHILIIKSWPKCLKHSDVLFRFQRILALQGKACKDLSDSILHRTTYQHNVRLSMLLKTSDTRWINSKKKKIMT